MNTEKVFNLKLKPIDYNDLELPNTKRYIKFLLKCGFKTIDNKNFEINGKLININNLTKNKFWVHIMLIQNETEYGFLSILEEIYNVWSKNKKSKTKFAFKL